MQKIKSSWFRFWASVLALVGVMHSNDADAATRSHKVLKCGGPTLNDDNGTAAWYTHDCKIDAYGVAPTYEDITHSSAVDCYCDDTTLLKYTVTCEVTSWQDPNSENVHKGYSINDTSAQCANPECTPDATRSCSTASYTGTQTCTMYGRWGNCEKTSCKNGYLLIDDVCYAECAIDGGEGYERVVNSESSSSSTEA